MTKILFEKGYHLTTRFQEDDKQGTIKIALKYNPSYKSQQSQIAKEYFSRFKKVYEAQLNLPRVLNGLEYAIISTSKGVITDKEARKLKRWW